QFRPFGERELVTEVERPSVKQRFMSLRVEQHPMVTNPRDLQFTRLSTERCLDRIDHATAISRVDAVKVPRNLRVRGKNSCLVNAENGVAAKIERGLRVEVEFAE